jgi:hypothetical protein
MDRCAVGLPSDPCDPWDAGARIVARVAGLEGSRQHADVVPVLRVHLGQRAAQKPRAARDDDLHGNDLAEVSRTLQNQAARCTSGPPG